MTESIFATQERARMQLSASAPSEVERQVNELEQAIQRVSLASSNIATRLISVLSHAMDSRGIDPITPKPVLCPHADILHDKANSLNRIADNLEETLSRIEV